jgi:hypothetical protein
MAAPLALSFAAYERSLFPESVLVNCFVEKSPTSQSSPLALLARPGLEDFKVVGSTPHRGIFQRSGLFDDDALLLANTTLYTLSAEGIATALPGMVSGDGLVDIDAGQDADLNSIAYIATGPKLYKVQAGSVVDVTADFANGNGATSVCFGPAQTWVFQETGTDQFYTQLPGETTFDPLEFATAEYAPDKGVAVRRIRDLVVFLNASTTEVWTPTGSADPPFEPYGGLKFDYGCRSRDAAVVCQGALLWVDNNCSVRMFDGGEPSIISDNGLAEQIRRVSAADISASTFSKDQHVYYVLRLSTTATWVYDLSTQAWAKWSSLGYDYWRAHLFANIGDVALALDSLSNQVSRLDPDRRTDGDDTFTVAFSAFYEAKDGPVPCANVELDCEVGNSPLSGQGSAPVIVLSMSDNEGKTFGQPKERSMGVTGDYSVTPRWNGLGTIKSPKGRIFKWQISDPVGRRFSGARMNAP